eukprot:gene36514-biopygen8280
MGTFPRLISLTLDDNYLSSTIPAALGNLKGVIQLTVNRNRLTGEIPASLSRLQSIAVLDLSLNSFTGTPPPSLCSFSSKVQIFLTGNHLACCPRCQTDGDWTAHYTVPRCPDYQDVAMSDVNSYLSVAAALVKIISTSVVNRLISVTDTQNTMLERIQYPDAFEYQVSYTGPVQLSAGLTFTLCADAACSVALVPKSYLAPFNAVVAQPYFYVRLSSVRRQSFTLTITIYSKSVSSWSFGTPPSNQSVDITSYAVGLCQSPWTGVTCSGGLVVGLNLRALGVKGKLPTSLGVLSGLTSLVMSSNGVSGSIVPELSHLTNLNTLELASNHISGTVPSALSTLTSLLHLDLSYNQLSQSVPTFFANMKNLLVLYADVLLLSTPMLEHFE